MKEVGKAIRRRLLIAGQVQGVGFRPFVYRLAKELALSGWVLNDSRGVTVEIQAPPAALDEFTRRLRSDLPPLASIARLEQEDIEPAAGEADFVIRASEGGELADAQVTVDTCVCDDCLREMNDPADPRYAYPFINCTNCGPRYTIVTRIPYDRPNTTMADFRMCELCDREYHDPSNRRFHAQPVACPICGPAVRLADSRGQRIESADAVAEAAKMLLAGKILAVKGLGGYHLACRADDDHVVRRLRERKHRDAKPLALMAADLAQVREIVEVSGAAEELLSGAIRPIVILPARRDASLRIAPSVAQGLSTLGVMLPYAPLHFLLFAHKLPPLVMTSGNYSEEPLVKDDDAAVAHLGGVADALLMHNRRIERGLDDSVALVHADGQPGMLRRARGYAPRPVQLDVGEELSREPVLAVGAELKNAVCLYRDGRAVLGEHVGDLKDGRAYRHFIDTIGHLEKLFDFQPAAVACDMHPQYLSTQYALRRHRGQLAGKKAIPLISVQHHHAHIAACMAENGVSREVIGLACDGVGFGDDGAVWGCEILRADFREYTRLGHLRYTPLVGADAAAEQTYRPAFAALYDAYGPECLGLPIASRLGATGEQLSAATEMIRGEVNSPPSSSLGRWFDATAAMTGVATMNRFEGEAPMMLEAAIVPGVEDAYAFEIVPAGEGPFTIDLRSMVRGIVADTDARIASGVIAAKFHNTVAEFLAASARRVREQSRLDTVAISGGCFANRYLTARLTKLLGASGFSVIRHKTVPAGDGAVALGQAVVAAAKLAHASSNSAATMSARKEHV